MDFERLSKYFSGEMKQHEKEELFSTLLDDENSVDEFARLKNIWAITQLHPEKSDKKTAKNAWSVFTNRTLKRNNRNRKYFWSQIAMLLLLIGVVGSISFYLGKQDRKEIPETYSVLSVPTGQSVQVFLPDSSEVWLNSCSKLTYSNNFGLDVREVLLEGEGYFKVHADEEHPFVVKTKMMDIIATGTQFNISAYDDDSWTSTTLIKGVVKVYSEQNNVGHQLKAGQMAVYNHESDELLLKMTDDDSGVAWLKGEFRFQDMYMEDIAKRLERKYDVSIVFRNNLMNKRRFTGTFYKNQSIENVLKVLSSQQLYYEVRQDTVYID